MEFSYKKNDNTDLFRDLEKDYLTNISKLQNYIPIYDKFFSLNESNYNSINLNNNYIKSIDNKESENKYKAVYVIIRIMKKYVRCFLNIVHY